MNTSIVNQETNIADIIIKIFNSISITCIEDFEFSYPEKCYPDPIL